jgi:hypothetical protein
VLKNIRPAAFGFARLGFATLQSGLVVWFCNVAKAVLRNLRSL